MGYVPEPWARKWLEEQRGKGERGLEVKVLSGGNHYLYRSTTVWNKDSKKREKRSAYLGTLTERDGFVPAERAERKARVRTIKECGGPRLIAKLSEPILGPLRAAFPSDWREIYAFAMLNALGDVPMKRAMTAWEGYEDTLGLGPRMCDRSLSDMIRAVGGDREAQNSMFGAMEFDGKELAYDLTAMFTRSKGISVAERGRNPKHVNLPQVNIVLLASQDKHLPVSIRAVPGSVRDVKTLASVLKETGTGRILIMDRGFFSEKGTETLRSEKIEYVVPVRRNSRYYGEVSVGEGFFMYGKDAVKYGKAAVRRGGPDEDVFWLYRFEDTTARGEEENGNYSLVSEGRQTMGELEAKRPRMGNLILTSDIDDGPEEIYRLYKRRDAVEKQFRRWKSAIDADASYMRDSEMLFGYVFVMFVSLWMLASVENVLRDKGMLKKTSVKDVLLEYSKAYVLDSDSPIEYEVPARLQRLDSAMGIGLFPK